jgi:hypothetical protein
MIRIQEQSRFYRHLTSSLEHYTHNECEEGEELLFDPIREEPTAISQGLSSAFTCACGACRDGGENQCQEGGTTNFVIGSRQKCVDEADSGKDAARRDDDPAQDASHSILLSGKMELFTPKGTKTATGC